MSTLELFARYERVALDAAGRVLAALSTPDLATDSYHGLLQRVSAGRSATVFTAGPRDSAPVTSPNGAVVVFLRAGVEGPPQLYAMPTDGGEPIALAEHPLGAGPVSFSPDGTTVTYLAAVPDPGRYGTAVADETPPKPDAEAPRRITDLAYRLDGKGFIGDKRDQVFTLRLVDETGALTDAHQPQQLTAEGVTIGRPVFDSAGATVLYARSAAVDSQYSEIARVAADVTEPTVGSVVASPRGDAATPVVADDQVFYIGSVFDGNDFAGRTPGLWSVPLAGGAARRLTDPGTVHIETASGDPIVLDGTILVAVADHGAVSLKAVPADGAELPLDALPTVIGGPRVVESFTVRRGQVAAVVSDPASCGDVVTGMLTELLLADEAAAAWTPLTDVSAPLRQAGLGRRIEITGTAPDGYPVHGWVVLPPEGVGTAPHPVLLNIHGGPHSAYTWGVFDEAHVYAAAGYAVVLGNPRGSAGYGQAHGRAIVGALGTVDADDVLTLLDTAAAREDLDGSRVGVMGGSYGGFMTSWLAAHAPERFVAGISERAVNAWDSFTGASDIGYFFADAYVGSDLAVQRDRSPLYHADDISIPLMIIHSEKDWRCPLEQAQRLYVALKLRGADTEMLIFPGEGHELSRSGRPKHRQARFDAILDWWARYLPV